MRWDGRIDRQIMNDRIKVWMDGQMGRQKEITDPVCAGMDGYVDKL